MKFIWVTSIKNGEKYLLNFSLVRYAASTKYKSENDTLLDCTAVYFGPDHVDWDNRESDIKFVKESLKEIEALL